MDHVERFIGFASTPGIIPLRKIKIPAAIPANDSSGVVPAAQSAESGITWDNALESRNNYSPFGSFQA